MPIRQLDPLLINQIAAGEVIERPASVVKEAVENSIDAGATRLVIDIEEGGRELIRISDNGHGIPEEELPLALTRHATSKINSTEDLAAILTMGFRGEALASIASIARITLISRPADADAASRIQIEGTEISPVTPTSRALGTTLEVRNLFFNTPARRRFMKSPATEIGHIQRIIRQIAMAHEDIAITLTHNGKKSMDYPSQSREARVKEIMGKDFAESALVFEGHEQNMHLWGMVPHPKLAKANSRSLHYFINGRPFSDARITHAVREAFRGLMEPSKYPMAVLFLTMPPELVDVNVHPTKAEVRFVDSNRIHGLVLSSLRQRLLAEDFTLNLEAPGSSSRLSSHHPSTQPGSGMTGQYPGNFSTTPSTPSTPTTPPNTSSTPNSPSSRGAYGNSSASSGIAYGSTSRNSGYGSSRPTPPPRPMPSGPNQISWDDLRGDSGTPEEITSQVPEPSQPTQQELGLNKAHLGPKHLVTPEGYLVIEDDQGLSILDPMQILLDWINLLSLHEERGGGEAYQELLKLFELNVDAEPENLESQLKSQLSLPFSELQVQCVLSFHRERLTQFPDMDYSGVVRMSLMDLEKLFKRS